MTMTRIPGLSHVHRLVSRYVPNLSMPQQGTLALWCVGIILAQSSGLTTVTAIVSLLVLQAEPAVRERLRSWYRIQTRALKAQQRNDRQIYRRRDKGVHTCFAPLLRWVVAWWDHQSKELPLAIDASTLGQRFTILAICVVIRGCAIPVAWKIVEATKKGPWKPHWEQLIETLHGIIPDDWTVLVLADRGLYAKWLFEAIQRNGWHPFLRINRQGQYCLEGETTYRVLRDVVTAHGQTWVGRVQCFKTKDRHLSCTLVARHDAGYQDPWLIVTDVAPDQVDVAWYALRAWIACEFKDSKRGGWHWEQTNMMKPEHAEWLWLAIAVATLWVVAVGCATEHAAGSSSQLLVVRGRDGRVKRTLSCFRRGRLVIIAAVCLRQDMPVARLIPEPWPSSRATDDDPAQPLT